MKASICGNQNRQCVAAPAYRQNMSPNTIFGENVEARMYNCSDVDKTVNISVKLPDSSPASDVDITHTCSGFINECYLGRTRSDGLWKAKIPKCATSVLILQKQGYATIKDSIKESYELEEIKNYSLSVNLIKASLFLKNYYLSNGFTSVHPNCIVVYGATQDLLRQTKSPLRKQGDKVTITLGGDYLEIPIIIYPSQSSIRLNSGKFNVSTSYTGAVTIQPSNYEYDDDHLTVSLNPSRSGNYNGIWFLGKNEFVWNINKSSLIGIGNNVRFYSLVEHYSDDSLEVKSLQNNVIQNDGKLSGRVVADKDCDGRNEAVDLTLQPQDYIKFITPEFS
jgi:hypothetical protein